MTQLVYSSVLSLLLVGALVFCLENQAPEVRIRKQTQEDRQAHNYNYNNNNFNLNHQARPIQFQWMSNQSPPPPLTHSRGASLILPANNEQQIQASNSIQMMSNNNPSRQEFAHHNLLPTEPPAMGAKRGPGSVVSSEQINSWQGNIELALRQASGDESVFQPQPTIGLHDASSSDWPPTQDGHKQQQQQVENINPKQGAPTTTTTTTTTTAATTTEQQMSNNIQGEPVVSQTSDYYQQELQKLSSDQQQQEVTPPIVQLNTTMDQSSNQVFYEGLATPASPAPGDYYFSSSERLPNVSEKSSNAWW